MNLKFLQKKKKTIIKSLKRTFGSHHGPDWSSQELELSNKPILTLNTSPSYIPILGLHNKISPKNQITRNLKSPKEQPHNKRRRHFKNRTQHRSKKNIIFHNSQKFSFYQ